MNNYNDTETRGSVSRRRFLGSLKGFPGAVRSFLVEPVERIVSSDLGEIVGSRLNYGLKLQVELVRRGYPNEIVGFAGGGRWEQVMDGRRSDSVDPSIYGKIVDGVLAYRNNNQGGKVHVGHIHPLAAMSKSRFPGDFIRNAQATGYKSIPLFPPGGVSIDFRGDLNQIPYFATQGVENVVVTVCDAHGVHQMRAYSYCSLIENSVELYRFARNNWTELSRLGAASGRWLSSLIEIAQRGQFYGREGSKLRDLVQERKNIVREFDNYSMIQREIVQAHIPNYSALSKLSSEAKRLGFELTFRGYGDL